MLPVMRRFNSMRVARKRENFAVLPFCLIVGKNYGSCAILVIAACHGGPVRLAVAPQPKPRLCCEQEPLAQEVDLGTP